MKRAFSETAPSRILLLLLLLFLPALPVLEAWAQENVTTAVNQAKGSGVQEESLNRVLILGYKHALKTDQLVDLILLTKEAKEQDFPVDQAVGKMEEGLAKRAQVQAVKQAVQREMDRFATARTLLQRTMTRRGMPLNELQASQTMRAADILTMGISEQAMKGFFNSAPKTSMNELVASLEFMAAIQQAQVSHETAQEITFAGLEKGFFSRGAWGLAQMIGVAKGKSLPESDIKSRALEVVRGEKSVLEARKSLGLETKDMARGPVVIGPADHGSGARDGGSEGHGAGSDGGGADASGAGGPGAGGGGGPEAGGAGAGGPDAGGSGGGGGGHAGR